MKEKNCCYTSKPTRCTFCVYLFCNFWCKSTFFERPFLSSSGVHDSAAVYSKSRTPDDERNGRSKHVELYKNCRINTHRKCILLVFLYNWLRCTVHTVSKKTVICLHEAAKGAIAFRLVKRPNKFRLGWKIHQLKKRQYSCVHTLILLASNGRTITFHKLRALEIKLSHIR